ncbi:MAG: tRNA lysidine(34) synthetase TilS [Bdellovibrio sp.]
MSVFKAKHDLEHHVWKLSKHHNLQNKKILVALSGGIDSVALLLVLTKVHNKNLLGAFHFHHGSDSNQEYRDGALLFCEELCKNLEINFYSLKFDKSPISAESSESSESSEFIRLSARLGFENSPESLKASEETKLGKSEEKYRELRYEALAQTMRLNKFEILSTAHHRDDLLETRLLRLIRGTGGQGLQAMRVFDGLKFRPFLEVTKNELKSYLTEKKQGAIDDPTNESLDPLRNWIRQDWLKALEKKSTGSTAALARSLETISHELEKSPWGDLLEFNENYKTQGLSRSFYLTLAPFEQKRLLAQYLFYLGKRDFSQSHLEEIQKRLDKSQKVITFSIAGCFWEVNAGQIKVQS